jgi:hypothetical protein
MGPKVRPYRSRSEQVEPGDSDFRTESPLCWFVDPRSRVGGVLMFLIVSLVTLGRHELRLLTICGSAALLFATSMFVYNYRHSKSDRDRTALSSAETNRLTGLP